jgi:CHASE2 domain-containing sensor protein
MAAIIALLNAPSDRLSQSAPKDALASGEGTVFPEDSLRGVYMRYQVGGSLTTDAPSYVERSADTQLYHALKQGEFCYVLNSRQMGKSSLLVRTKHRLEGEGFLCTAIDLTGIGSENVTPEQWYKGVVSQLWLGYDLLGKVNLKTWWRDREDLPILQRLSQFITDVLLTQFPDEKLVIFIDEIDSVLSLPFTTDDFFAFIRYCYNQRAIDSAYKPVTFAIFGVATPSDLIRDKTRTPFNIGQAIALDGFTLDEAQPLARGLRDRSDSNRILQEILTWTGGQPFLTQKLCQIVIKSNPEESVDTLVRSRIIHQWESQDEPQHLRTISHRLLHNDRLDNRLLGIYQQLLVKEPVNTDDSREQIELLLSGLVVSSGAQLQIKNPIYQAVFNAQWVAKQLENLRPYAESFNRWSAANQQDESHLLRGLDLKEALAWADNKQLSDLDYRFLSASQELAKRAVESDLKLEKGEREKAQFALEAAKQAHQILSRSRQSAKERSRNWRLGKRWIAGIAAIATTGVLLLRYVGVLQATELATLDWLFQHRPPEAIDPRIALITIDEPDLQQIGQYPIPDRILAQAIANLKQHQPTAIGLDIYRDLPVEPGSQDLAQIFKTTPNLVGIEKAIGARVAPSAILAELGQIGFADQVLDGDGKIRRALLTVRPPHQNLKFSLSLKLALKFLEKQGIEPKPLKNSKMQLGKAVLIPFTKRDGGYVRATAGGYQILLNYRGTQQQFERFSLVELLENQIPPDRLRDRIVLIGATAESINDMFQTPYSSRTFASLQQMAGVTIHANIVSQLLSAAIDGRSLLRVWSKPIEWLWILGWSGVGAILAWQLKLPQWILLSVLGMSGIIVMSVYLAFLQGWWIPAVPAMLAAIGSAIALPVATQKVLEKIQLDITVNLLIEIARDQPASGQIAIEYLKQSETPEHRSAIDKLLQEQKQS